MDGECPVRDGRGSDHGGLLDHAAAGPPVGRLLALIPAHNEAPRIAQVVRGALAHLDVLVVDDGSSDATAAAAASAGATVVRLSPNRGKGGALQAGFRHALDARFDGVVTLDGDGQHDPAELPRFVAAATTHPQPDLVIGRRNFRAMPPTRRLANDLGRRAFSWAVGRDVPDNQSGYRLISRRLMSSMLDAREGGFELEIEMIAVAIRDGFVIDSVPIRTIYAGEPSHIRPIAHLRGFVRTTLRAWRTVRSTQ